MFRFTVGCTSLGQLPRILPQQIASVSSIDRLHLIAEPINEHHAVMNQRRLLSFARIRQRPVQSAIRKIADHRLRDLLQPDRTPDNSNCAAKSALPRRRSRQHTICNRRNLIQRTSLLSAGGSDTPGDSPPPGPAAGPPGILIAFNAAPIHRKAAPASPPQSDYSTNIYKRQHLRVSLPAQSIGTIRRHPRTHISEHVIRRFPAPLLQERRPLQRRRKFPIVQILPMA